MRPFHVSLSPPMLCSCHVLFVSTTSHTPSCRCPRADNTSLPRPVRASPTALRSRTCLPWYAGDRHTTTLPTTTPPGSAGQMSVVLLSGDRCMKTSSASNTPLSSGTISRVRECLTFIQHTGQISGLNPRPSLSLRPWLRTVLQEKLWKKTARTITKQEMSDLHQWGGQGPMPSTQDE